MLGADVKGAGSVSAGRSSCPAAVSGHRRHPIQQHTRGRLSMVTRSGGEGFFSPAFQQALSDAMERDQHAAADLYDNARSRGGNDYSSDYGYSRRESSSNGSWRAQNGASTTGAEAAGPLLQVLATALGQCRATLERLQAEEAEIENLIQRERKQVERLEWLLTKIQQDYAFFNSLQNRFDNERR